MHRRVNGFPVEGLEAVIFNLPVVQDEIGKLLYPFELDVFTGGYDHDPSLWVYMTEKTKYTQSDIGFAHTDFIRQVRDLILRDHVIGGNGTVKLRLSEAKFL